jgi:hypothetical protein
MSVTRYVVNEVLTGERGIKVLCEQCRQPGDEVLWRLLYLALRDPGTRMSKEKNEKAVMSAYYHLKEFPGHEIVILDMKKLK